MRLRSEWITVATLTGLAVWGLLPPRHAPAEAPKRETVAAGVDYMPTGSARPSPKARTPRPRH